MPEINYPVNPSRDQLRATGQGILSQPYDRQCGRSTTTLADGTIYFQGVGLLAGDVVTNVILQTNGTCAGLTLAKVGLYKKDGTRLAISADQGAAWQAANIFVVAMTAAYTVPANDLYYLAIITKTGTSTPTVPVGLAAAPLTVTGASPASGTMAAQTDLISNATISAANSVNIWLACS